MMVSRKTTLSIFSFSLIAGLFLFLYFPCQGAEYSYEYKNYLSYNSFTGLIQYFFSQIQTLVGYLAILFLVIGGIVYMTSAGRKSQTELAKNIVTMAILGFALAVAVPSILKGMVDMFTSSSTSGASSIDSAKSLKTILANVLDFLLTGVGMLAMIGFAVGGFLYLTAAGDSGQSESGKRAILYSIIAIALSGTGIIIVRQVLNLLSGTM